MESLALRIEYKEVEPTGEPPPTGLVWIELSDQLTVAFYDAAGTLEHEGSAPHPRGLTDR